MACVSAFVTSLMAVIRYTDKSDFREKGLILACSSRVQFLMEGKSRQQGLKAVAHIAFTITKQRTRNTCFYLSSFPLLCSLGPNLGHGTTDGVQVYPPKLM